MRLLSATDLKMHLPLSSESAVSIETHRHTIQRLMQGKDARFVFIMGPCSLHDENSSLEYGRRIKALQKKVRKNCFLVMRAHIEKPRTYLGWKGMLYDPLLNDTNDIELGLFKSRSLLLELAHLEIPLATEFLDPLAASYYSDLISWGFIGARTSDSQPHRHLASSLPMPIGFKNARDGYLEGAILGALSAQSPHSFLAVDEEGHLCKKISPGNPFSHIVLRGSISSANYTADQVENALLLSRKNGLFSRLLIDCAHGNSGKDPLHQISVCKNVLEQCINGNEFILGAMIESHLKAGNQLSGSSCIDPSISVTDPCIDWSTTEELVLSLSERLSSLLCIS